MTTTKNVKVAIEDAIEEILVAQDILKKGGIPQQKLTNAILLLKEALREL